MKRLGLLACLSLSCVGVSSATFAADVSVQSHTHDWTGLYLGANVAYRNGEMTQSCTGGCPPDDAGMDGFYFGVQAGYDYQFESGVVLGAFILAGLTPPSDSFDIYNIREFDVEPSYGILFAGRLGYAIDEFLPYVFGGYGVSQVNVDASWKEDNHPQGLPDNVDNTHHGYALGAGVDWMMTEHISLGAQYMYSSFEKEEYDFGGNPPIPKFGENANTFALLVNYRF